MSSATGGEEAEEAHQAHPGRRHLGSEATEEFHRLEDELPGIALRGTQAETREGGLEAPHRASARRSRASHVGRLDRDIRLRALRIQALDVLSVLVVRTVCACFAGREMMQQWIRVVGTWTALVVVSGCAAHVRARRFAKRNVERDRPRRPDARRASSRRVASTETTMSTRSMRILVVLVSLAGLSACTSCTKKEQEPASASTAAAIAEQTFSLLHDLGFGQYGVSSHQSPFWPENLRDRDAATSWRPKAKPGGVGEWVSVTFPGRAEVREIDLDNGAPHDAKGNDTFATTNRVKKASVKFSDGSTEVLELADVAKTQVFTFRPREVESFKLVVDEVYRAEKPTLLALSGLEVVGRPLALDAAKARKKPCDPDDTSWALQSPGLLTASYPATAKAREGSTVVCASSGATLYVDPRRARPDAPLSTALLPAGLRVEVVEALEPTLPGLPTLVHVALRHLDGWAKEGDLCDALPEADGGTPVAVDEAYLKGLWLVSTIEGSGDVRPGLFGDAPVEQKGLKGTFQDDASIAQVSFDEDGALRHARFDADFDPANNPTGSWAILDGTVAIKATGFSDDFVEPQRVTAGRFELGPFAFARLDPRYWSSAVRYAKPEWGLKMRSLPNFTSEEVSKVPFGEPVALFAEQCDEHTEEGVSGHWTKIAFDGAIGYAFSGKLSSTPPDGTGIVHFNDFYGDWDERGGPAWSFQKDGVALYHAGPSGDVRWSYRDGTLTLHSAQYTESYSLLELHGDHMRWRGEASSGSPASEEIFVRSKPR